MAHFAKIEDGVVTNVVVVDNAHEANGEAYLNGLGLDGTWVQTSYNANFGKKFAAIGDTYDSETKFFIPKKPYASWVFDEINWTWTAPKPVPDEENPYYWDETLLEWVLEEFTNAENTIQ